jgi:fibro-slime domain-containing protein
MTTALRALTHPLIRPLSALLLIAGCGGQPDVASDNGSVAGTSASGGSGGTGGRNGSGATGGTGIIVEGEGGNAGESEVDPCEGDDPPSDCFGLEPSGPACGDGEVNQAEEECDDDNSLPGDGCSGVCQVEPYFECEEEGEPCVPTIECGDGVLDPGEFCDDGNDEEDDGCSADCLMQDPDYVCPEPGEDCRLLYDCGDGRVNGSEQCDDGGDASGDGCSDTCQLEAGWVCRRPGMPCALDEYCGDGIIQSGEECDDGDNENWGDGCSLVCTVDPFYECDVPGEPCEYTIICGNGELEPGEACDDGNNEDFDGCDNECKQDQSYNCPTPGESCTLKYPCGDGRINGADVCDDGNTNNGDGCSADCRTIENGYVCRRPGMPCALDIRCGDGSVQTGEECDDGDTDWGDGCSGICTKDPYYDCPSGGGACTSTIVCGDGRRDPGEQCDDHNTTNSDGCTSTCTIQSGYVCPTVGQPCIRLVACGDGRVSGSESCDDRNTASNDGCSSTCQIETGYTCATPGQACTRTIVCGDGKREGTEQCDDGDTTGSDGCSGQCRIENDWSCTGAAGGLSTCTYTVVCGDGALGGTERCDDDNTTSGDGCSSNCQTIETGYKCARAGSPCTAICGDGIIKGTEQCDILNPNATAQAACVQCRLQPGYTCGASGTGPCTTTTCGNATAPTDVPGSTAYINTAKSRAEPGEGCDDGNTIAGDGCGPTCQLEPVVTVGTNPSVATTCGDGLVTGTEECDDGNIVGGDGCAYFAAGDSRNCKVETGFSCSGSVSYPDSIAFRVTYRDFRQRNETGGHPHMRVQGTAPPDQGTDLGIVGSVCTVTTNGSNTCGRLDAQGKPAYVGSGTHNTIDPASDTLSATYHQDAFKLWYRDTNGTGTLDAAGGSAIVIDASPDPMPASGMDTITLGKLTGLGNSATKSAYQFSSDNNTFYPLGSAAAATPFERGFGYTPYSSGTNRRNWHFTSELRYFFQYQGGETLTFFGDDDVWVFINGRLAVDIGGIHGTLYGRVVLGDDGDGSGSTQGNCSAHAVGSLSPATCTLDANEVGGDDKRFSLTIGQVYEIVVFQAERHPTGSNYRLTLDGFLAPRSTCAPICGKNPVAQGSGVTVTPPEECDDGDANTSTLQYGKCQAGTCKLGPYCGDGTQNGTEVCDNGSNNAQYGQSGCAPGCVLPSSCGDGIIDSPFEQCDLGSGNTVDGYGGCRTNCTIGPRCGDGAVNGSETCDDGVNDGSYEGCSPGCTPAPRCGDGNIDSAWGEICDGGSTCDASCQLKCGNGTVDAGEQCDDGINAGGYGRCSPGCVNGPSCGDNVRNGPEQCDDGVNDGGYGECAAGCVFGPSCGDGMVNGPETCDDGVNDGYYETCNANCTPGPRCGDGDVQVEWGELCDDLGDPNCNGCRPIGICGDAFVQDPPETCDDGVNDGSYGHCTAQCLEGPHCGDGVVQSQYEQCDEGPGGNDGGYDECSSICRLGGYCGDGVVNGPELCDDGVNDEFYGSCTPDCGAFGPRCGDSEVQEEWGEECDDPDDENCENCRLGAQCGDSVVQSGEACDDGTNDGGYGECGPRCEYGPRCGDGVVQSAHEQCDDGEGNNTGGYGMCAPGCVYGPYCGDGKTQSSREECDDGNSRNGDGCSSACRREIEVPR